MNFNYDTESEIVGSELMGAQHVSPYLAWKYKKGTFGIQPNKNKTFEDYKLTDAYKKSQQTYAIKKATAEANKYAADVAKRKKRAANKAAYDKMLKLRADKLAIAKARQAAYQKWLDEKKRKQIEAGIPQTKIEQYQTDALQDQGDEEIAPTMLGAYGLVWDVAKTESAGQSGKITKDEFNGAYNGTVDEATAKKIHSKVHGGGLGMAGILGLLAVVSGGYLIATG